MKTVEDLIPLKLYPASDKLYVPMNEKDKRKGSAILILADDHESVIQTMTNPLLINNGIFTAYYAEKDVNAIINHEGAILNEEDSINESNMLAKERKSLKDSQFGLPHKRKYPLQDKAHVLAAIRMFNHVGKDDEGILADNIKIAISKFKMEEEVKVGEDNRFSKYYNHITEAVIFKSQTDNYPRIIFESGSMANIAAVSKVINFDTMSEICHRLDNKPVIANDIHVYIHDEMPDVEAPNEIHVMKPYGFNDRKYGPYDNYLKHEVAIVCIRSINPDVNKYLESYIAIWLADQTDYFKGREDVYINGALSVKQLYEAMGTKSVIKLIKTNDTTEIAKVAAKCGIKNIRNMFPYQEVVYDELDIDNVFAEAESTVNGSHPKLRVSSKPTTNPNDPVSHKAVHLDFYNKDEHIGQVFISSVDTDNGFIYNLVVFEKYRGQGYGRQIMEYVLSHYNARELTVSEDNTEAVSLYKSMGFKLKKTFNDSETHKKMLWMRRSGGVGITEAKANITGEMDQIIELNKKLNKYEYGLSKRGAKVKKQNTTAEDYDRYYRVASPAQFEKQEGGICWDFATYEADYFNKHFPNIDYTSWYIVFEAAPDYPTHTFITFKYGGKHVYFESSFSSIAGMWVADSENDILNFVMKSMADYASEHRNLLKRPVHVYKYDATDSKIPGSSTTEFMNHVEQTGKKYHHVYSPRFKINPMSWPMTISDKK